MKRLIQKARRSAGAVGWLLVAILPGLLSQTGCQSIEATTVLGTVEQEGRTAEDVGAKKVFLEVAAPEPPWIREDQARRDKLLEASYQDDLKRGFIAYVVPVAFRLDLKDFQLDAAQEKALAPYIVLQLRERRLITVKKKHQVTKRSLFARGPDIAIEQVPVWSFWRPIPSEERTEWTDRLTIQLPEELETPGLFSTVSGPVDADGNLRLSLAPWLSQATRRGKDLRLLVTCPKRQLSIEVIVSRDVLLHQRTLAP